MIDQELEPSLGQQQVFLDSKIIIILFLVNMFQAFPEAQTREKQNLTDNSKLYTYQSQQSLLQLLDMKNRYLRDIHYLVCIHDILEITEK